MRTLTEIIQNEIDITYPLETLEPDFDTLEEAELTYDFKSQGFNQD